MYVPVVTQHQLTALSLPPSAQLNTEPGTAGRPVGQEWRMGTVHLPDARSRDAHGGSCPFPCFASMLHCALGLCHKLLSAVFPLQAGYSNTGIKGP